MKAENWIKVKEALLESLVLPPEVRHDFLKKTVVSHEVRREVESLLTHESEAQDFMSMTASGFGKDFFNPGENLENSPVGKQIGVYEIVSELGYGGMGAVYLAARTDGKFSQRVAVKMLKREFNTEKIRRNFNREKEILAALAHPNIATLIDAGTTGDGVPYLVMEYIEGKTIDVYCRENELTLNERLKLFNLVCDAVAFAHRNLVIHRDLKPSNILVTKNGKPKLLDFGISKLLGVPTDEQTSTDFGAMTPQYASPEQIRGETVTTATDIYSLGVILFKILTGNFPYDFNNKLNGNLFKEITETEPTLPSQTISTNKDEEFKLISASQLKGDLDNIILKSLCKEPERRYKTVEQFTADIWRFVDGLPVQARPNTFSYRANKFYRRNRVSVLAAVLILISLFAGISIAVSQANAAKKQAQNAALAQRQAEVETEKAKSEEEKAKKISNFMAKIISYANPAWYAEGSKFGGNARVIDVLDDLSGKIDEEFAGQADVQAELHHKFTEVYTLVGRDEKDSARLENFARKRRFHALRALELRKQFYGERHELVAKDLFYSYGILGADEREKGSLLAEAIQMMRETNPQNLNLPYMLEAYASRLALPPDANYHKAYRDAVVPPTVENNYQIAERYLREALVGFRLHYKKDNYAIFMNECRLAFILAMQEKWSDFDEHFAICKQGEKELLLDEYLSKQMRTNVELVEKALKEQKSGVSK